MEPGIFIRGSKYHVTKQSTTWSLRVETSDRLHKGEIIIMIRVPESSMTRHRFLSSTALTNATMHSGVRDSSSSTCAGLVYQGV